MPDAPATPFEYSLRTHVGSARGAQVVVRALNVDAELKPDIVQRDVCADGEHVVGRFQATELRALRAAVSAFIDLLALACNAVDQFGGEEAQAIATN